MASKGDRRRQQILDALSEMVRTQSFDDISIAEITRRAEVTRPGFYFYFPTKGAAIATLMEELFNRFMTAADVWYNHGGDDQYSALRAGMHDTVEIWRANANMMHCIAQAAEVDPQARSIWQRWISLFISRAVPTIAEDVHRDLDGTPVSPEDLADILVSTVFDAMRRDVRSIVETGRPLDHLPETLTLLWARTLYPTTCSHP